MPSVDDQNTNSYRSIKLPQERNAYSKARLTIQLSSFKQNPAAVRVGWQSSEAETACVAGRAESARSA